MNKISKAMGEVLIFPIKFYRRFISPMKKPCCKYYPTCSEYAILAIRKYGPVKGSIKGAWRILRCNPFSRGGVDEP